MTNGGGSGRDKLFAEIFDRHYARMVRYLRGYNVPVEDARDLAQEVFARFYERIEQYRGDAEWGFLEKIGRRLLCNWWRDRSALKRTAHLVDIDAPEFADAPPATETPDYAERVDAARHRKLLYDAIAALPVGQQQCLHLWLDGFKFKEIAEVLRVTLDAVKSRLRDARRTLIERLGDHAAASELGRILPEDEE
jgi:RNA polymerase sigma-70 factor (ECF subfamily)